MLRPFIYLWRTRWTRRIILGVVGVVVIGGVCYWGGWYPLLYVDGTPIWAYQYRTSVKLTHNFYSTMAQKMNVESIQDAELEKVVLDGLVDDVLITHELRTQMSSDEISQKTNAQVNSMISSGDGRTQMLSLTQVSESDSRTYLLNYIARGQVLSDLFTLQQKEIIPWLMEQRNQAHISFVGMSGTWSGEKGYEKK